jgi:DNA invertase Pin-like site-specific DNA recombinase
VPKPRSRTPRKRASRKQKRANPFRQPGSPLRAALYARVSTPDQQTVPTQLDALRRYAKDRGWKIVAEVRDVGSGALARPKRDELMKGARRKEIDVVLVWRLDRWGRSVADLALTLKELHELGVAFVSFTEALDLTTPIGRAMAGLLSVFAEFEREVLRERILAGMAAARKRGQQFGRPIKVEVHRAEIQRLRAAGQSISAIARTFNIARSTVRLYLT